jgi:hypothetical protein
MRKTFLFLAALVMCGSIGCNTNTAPPEFGQGWEPMDEAERHELYGDEADQSIRQLAPHLFDDSKTQ